jgi:hypothetical protein
MRTAHLGIWILGGLLLAGSAGAATMTWRIEGVVRHYHDGDRTSDFPSEVTALGIDAGAPLSVTLELDDSLPDTMTDPDTGAYEGALVGGGLSVGSLVMDITLGQLTTALNRVGDNSLYRIMNNLGAVTTNFPGLISLPVIAVDLIDTGQDVINTEAFPSAPPNLADLDAYEGDFFTAPFETSVQFGFFDGTRTGFAIAEITSLDVVSMPEPGTFALVAFGLVGMAAKRRPGRGR